MTTPPTKPSLYILYGSATGNAEQIAKDLTVQAQSSSNDFASITCHALETFKRHLDKWLQPPTTTSSSSTDTTGKKHGIIVITSTTGNGDAPENASKFVRYLKRKTTVSQQPFQHCAYAVLGLGDTNYDNFCATGKIVDLKMTELGGTRVKPLSMADEATGLEDVVEPFMTTVLDDIRMACCFSTNDQVRAASTATATEGNDNEVLQKSSHQDNSTTTTRREAEDKEATTTSPPPAVASPPPPAAAAVVSSSPLIILYGSATGNAEHIAKELASTYESLLTNPEDTTATDCFFPSVTCCEMDQYKKQRCSEQWEQVPAAHGNGNTKHGIIIVTSTTGNGDAPENASRFVRYLKRRSTVDQQPFRYCAFAVLGLGDTNYDQFCATGKVVDRKMAELGGTRAKTLAMADEATGLEDVVEPWTSSVLADITVACRGGGSGGDGHDTTIAPSSNDTNVPKSSSTPSSRTNTDSSRAEEKKMESDVVVVTTTTTLPETPPTPSTTSSIGIATVRSLLSLDDSSAVPEVNDNTLPSLGTSLSSCQLVHDETETRRKSRGMSLVDAMDHATISSGSTATLHYTMNKPHETTILNASYLTKTSTEAASTVAKLIGDKPLDDALLIKAMETYEGSFPLNGPDDNTIAYDCNSKRVIEMTLSLPDDFTLEYQPGDSLGIVVTNTPQAVQYILQMLEEKHNVKPSQKVSIDSNHPVTVEEAVRTYIDLCSPLKNKRVLHSLSQFTNDAEESSVLRLLASKTPHGEELFKTLIDDQRMTVVDVLKAFPSCQRIPLEGLIGMLPGIPPRYYSVSSSPLDPRNGALALTVAFSVVDYLTPSLVVNNKEIGQRRIGGVATRFLEVVCSGFLCGNKSSSSPSTLKIFPKPTTDFHLPPLLSTPLILIGPGTGIAPFVGFLRHRQAQSMKSQQAATSVVEGTWRGDYELQAQDLPVSKSDAPTGVLLSQHHNLGTIQVFFGCRRADHDWLFQDELEQLKKDDVITDLYTAFSRQEPKRYVQDIMIHDEVCRSSLVDLIVKENASVYICGDGNEMAKDVQNALMEVVSPHVEDAAAYLEDMKKGRRLVMDIWTS